MTYNFKRKDFEEAEELHHVNDNVVVQLERVKARIDAAIDAYKDRTKPEHMAEFNIRQSLHVLKDVRRTLLHG